MNNKIFTCLWFDNQAKEATEHYCSIFENSKILSENPMIINFELNGFRFMALNGGPMYQFSPATSFVIECENQQEIDYYWDKLGDGGQYNHCGWLSDKFGVSCQIVPKILSDLMSNPDKAPKVVAAFLKMSKFDIKTLINANN